MTECPGNGHHDELGHVYASFPSGKATFKSDVTNVHEGATLKRRGDGIETGQVYSFTQTSRSHST